MIGGSSVKENVRRVMSSVMCNDVSRLYNWAGKYGWKSKDNTVKRAFGNLKLAAAILSMYISEVPVKAISDQNQCNIHLHPPENPTDDIMIKI